MQLGKVIADTIKEKDDIKPQLGAAGSVTYFFNVFMNKLKISSPYCIIKTRQLGSEFLIWDHTARFWGTHKWSNTPYQSFILGHDGAGVLGTSKLGDAGDTFITERVVQENNIYKEPFYTDRFKGTGSLYNWDTGSQCLYLNI